MPSRARQVPVEPPSDRVKGRVGKLLVEEPPDPREVDEVVRLPIAPPQSGEDPEDLAIALSREDGRRSQKRHPVERRKSSKIALGHPQAEVGRNVAPGIFEERYEIVAPRAEYRALKIEKPPPHNPQPVLHHHQFST